jgi:hypothetical protein
MIQFNFENPEYLLLSKQARYKIEMKLFSTLRTESMMLPVTFQSFKDEENYLEGDIPQQDPNPK